MVNDWKLYDEAHRQKLEREHRPHLADHVDAKWLVRVARARQNAEAGRRADL